MVPFGASFPLYAHEIAVISQSNFEDRLNNCASYTLTTNFLSLYVV